MARNESKSLIRVRYAETDQMGFTYHAHYLAWFEVARTNFCRETGIPYREWEAQGVMLPCVEAHCRYKSPALYDDEVTVVARVDALTSHTVTFGYRVEREGKLLAEGWTKHGFCDARGKLLKAPEPFYGLLRTLFETSNNARGGRE